MTQSISLSNHHDQIFNSKENIWLVLTIFWAILNSYIFTNLFFKSGYTFEIILGWLLALIFNFTGLMIKLFAFGHSARRFFICTFLLTPLNAAIFLGTVFFVIYHGPVSAKPLITATFISYFTFLIYDIFKLRSLKL